MGYPLGLHPKAVSQIPSSLESEIKARALSLGFTVCGITTPDTLDFHHMYVNWLERGLNAGMTYLASAYHVSNRLHPEKFFPGLKSIILLGYRYPLQHPAEIEEKTTGLISGYASGKDYHHLIPNLASPLLQYLTALNPEAPAPRVYTDSAPVLERELAVRSGLGWIGRNSCLISPKHGSNLLLAEIFTAIALQADPPFAADHCGSCMRCVESCPTGCILPERVIDANRCLSYHNIENKGMIPPEVMEKFGGWIFGCEICQMVCPWNQRGYQSSSSIGIAGQMTVEEMLEFLELSMDDFKSRFAETALARARYNGLRRNVIIRLANLGEKNALGSIKRTEDTAELDWLRDTARWARNKIQLKK